MIIQLCGLSGSGKSTLPGLVKEELTWKQVATVIMDGDAYRKALCSDLGYSREDRYESIRRLGFVANKLSVHGIVVIIAAINLYEEIRREMKDRYRNVFTVFVDCPLMRLIYGHL